MRSELYVELHSDYAIRLWVRRKAQQKKDTLSVGIISMPQMIHRIEVMARQVTMDNPYADAMLYEVEQTITASIAHLESLLGETRSTLAALPKRITITEVASSEPLSVPVYSDAPLGYRCVWLLVCYDQLVLAALQAYHYGLISRSRKDKLIDSSHYVRKVYGVMQQYRLTLSWAVTRQDLKEKTPLGLEAISHLGEPDADILSGKRRSSFASRLHTDKVEPA